MTSRHFAPALLLCLPYPAVAQGPEGRPAAEGGEVLAEKVITATRLPGEAWEAPFAVRELGRETLEERLPRSLPEALREIPGVSVQKTAPGQGSPHIRGFTGFRTLALIDGVRFNNSTFREGPNQYWSTIDLLAMERLELVPGQGSVLYGSDAIGGTLNLLTKQSGFREEAAGKPFSGGLGMYRYSSAEDSHTGHVEYRAGEGDRWGVHFDGTGSQFGELRAAGLGRQARTGFDQWSYHGRWDARVDPNWTVSAVHQQLRQDDVWRTHSTVYGMPWEGTVVGTDLRRSFDQARSLSYVKLAGRQLEGWFQEASLTLSYQTEDETLTRVRKDGSSQLSGVDLGTYGADLQFSSETGAGLLTYGVDYYRDQVGSSGVSYLASGAQAARAIQGPVGDDASYDLLGAYVQDEIALGARGHLFLGGRSTWARAAVGRMEDPVRKQAVSLEESWDDFSASGRVVWDLGEAEQAAAYAGVSQGFRAPNLSDVSRFDVARSGEWEIGGEDLQPEQFINYEVGIRAAAGGFSGNVSVFHTRIEDLIVRQPTGGKVDELVDVSKANGGEGHVQGVEVAARMELSEHWSVFGHASYTEGEVDQYPGSDGRVAREPLSRVVPWMGELGLRWQGAGGRCWAELVGSAASRADRLNSGEQADGQRIPPGGTPGWLLLGCRGGWKVNPHLSLTASLENLLDEEYRSHGSGSNEAGLGGTVGVALRF